MRFREFYYYNEAVQLLRMFWPAHDITKLGVYGWWEVYYVNKVERVGDAPQFTNKRVKDSTQVKFFAQSPIYEKHRAAQALASRVCTDAAYKLGALGWPRQTSVLVLMEDRIPEKNHITGGEIGGEAWRKKHGIRIPVEFFDTYILLHEHAHMMWFNMSKPGKTLFETWYKTNSTAGAENPDFYKRLTVTLKDYQKDSIKSSFGYKAHEIANETLTKLNERRGANHKLYFDAHTLAKEDRMEPVLREILFQKPNVEQTGRLKRRMKFYGSGGTDFDAFPGELVKVWRLEEGYQFKMRWDRDDGRQYMGQDMESWDMWDYVEFDLALLPREQQAQVKKTMGWMKKSLQGYFAPKEDERAFAEDLWAALMKHWPKINNADDWMPEVQPQGALDPVAIHGAFASAVRKLKFKDLVNEYYAFSEIVKVLTDVLKASFDVEKLTVSGGEGQQKRGAKELLSYLSVPQGSELRTFLAQRHGFPSSYGAANVDELWAETVARAAQNPRSIDQGLRQVLIQAVTIR